MSSSNLTPEQWAIYERGLEDGYAQGAAEEAGEQAEAWHEVADPASRSGPSHAELEERRWGPGGREHFGDPRPGDYRGKEAEAAREAGSRRPFQRQADREAG